jgi:hypothetical protein
VYIQCDGTVPSTVLEELSSTPSTQNPPKHGNMDQNMPNFPKTSNSNSHGTTRKKTSTNLPSFPSLFDPIFRIPEKWHLDFLKSRRFRTLSFKATHYCKFLAWSLLARLCRLGVIRSVIRRGSRQMTLLKVRRRVGRESCKKSGRW